MLLARIFSNLKLNPNVTKIICEKQKCFLYHNRLSFDEFKQQTGVKSFDEFKNSPIVQIFFKDKNTEEILLGYNNYCALKYNDYLQFSYNDKSTTII